jgi:PAS domain S-box-containing protein
MTQNRTTRARRRVSTESRPKNAPRKSSSRDRTARRFEQIIDTIPVLAWTALPDGRADFFNRQWLEYTGLAHRAVLGWAWKEVIHPEDRDRVIQHWQQLLLTGEPCELEARLRRFDGEYRWFLIRANAFRDPSGRILKWYGTNTDIEERRRAEQLVKAGEEDLRRANTTLKESEARIRLIVDTIPGLIFTLTPIGELEFVNCRLLQYFNRSLEALQVWKLTDAVHSADLAHTINEVERGIESGRTFEFEQRLRRHDGAYRWFRWKTEPLHDDSGQITRWYGLLADIDDLKVAQEAIKTSERDLRLLIDSIPGLVYTMTPTCELELVNKQVLDYFGRTFEELQDWSGIGVVHPDDMPRVLHSLQRTVDCGEPHEVEQRLRRADGVYRWYKPHALPARDANGRIARWYCLLADIDDLKRAEETLRTTQTRLSKATQFSTMTEIAASIAHEINQPLAAVVAHGHACSRWLSANPPNIERARLSASRIIRDGNAAADVVQRIRSLFRYARLRKDRLNLDEAIIEVLSLFTDDLRLKRVTLQTELASGAGQVLADRVQVQQVIANLARNGIEAMESVADRPKLLSVSSSRNDREIVVLVRDAGVGLSDPNAVFDSFYTTKENGMGIGLAICRTIIEAHNGRLWAAQNTPYGATFGFALRLAEEEAS